MTHEDRSGYIKKIVEFGLQGKCDEGMEAFAQFANEFSTMFAEQLMPYSELELLAVIAGLELLSKTLRGSNKNASDMANSIIESTKVCCVIETDGKIENYEDGKKVEGFTIFEGKL